MWLGPFVSAALVAIVIEDKQEGGLYGRRVSFAFDLSIKLKFDSNNDGDSLTGRHAYGKRYFRWKADTKIAFGASDRI